MATIATVIPDLVRSAIAGDKDAAQELATIAAADPSGLKPYLMRLLEGNVLAPVELYQAAPGEVVQRMIERVERGEYDEGEGDNLAFLVVQQRHELAGKALLRWHTSPPVGVQRLRESPLNHAKEEGWAIDAQGNRHELCAPVAFELVMRPAPQNAAGDTCRWCETPLWTVLDVDTAQAEAAQALAHTGWSGRLRVSTCHLCTNWAPIYVVVDPSGGSSWSSHNRLPDYAQTGPPEEPPYVLPVVGAQRSTLSPVDSSEEFRSTLGGVPEWLQHAEFLDCPECGFAMDYVGLISGADLEWGEGVEYVFLHGNCGLAGVVYQQT